MSYGVDSPGFEYFTEVFSKEYKVDKSVLSGVARQVWENELTDADRASWEEMARQSQSRQHLAATSSNLASDDLATPWADDTPHPEPAPLPAATPPSLALDDQPLDLDDINIDIPFPAAVEPEPEPDIVPDIAPDIAPETAQAPDIEPVFVPEEPPIQQAAGESPATPPAETPEEDIHPAFASADVPEVVEDIKLEDLLPPRPKASPAAPQAELVFTPPASIQETRPAQQPEAPGEEPAPEPVSPRMETPAAADAPKGEPQEATDAASAEGAQVETLGAETPMPLESMVLEPMTLEIEAPKAEAPETEAGAAEVPAAPPLSSLALPDAAEVADAAEALEPLELEHEAEEAELPSPVEPEVPAAPEAPEKTAINGSKSEVIPEPEEAAPAPMAQSPALPEQAPEEEEPVFALEDLAPPPAGASEIPPVGPKISGIPELPGLQAEQPAADDEEPGKAIAEEAAPDDASLAADEFTFQLEETGAALPLAETPPAPQEKSPGQPGEFSEEIPEAAPGQPAAASPRQPPRAEAVFTAPRSVPESPGTPESLDTPASAAPPTPPALSLDLQREILSRLAARHPLPGKEEPRPTSDATAASRPTARPESRAPQAVAASAPPAPQAGSAARLGTSARQRPAPPPMGERPAERPIERPAERGPERRAERGAERGMDQSPASPLGQTLAGRSRREAKSDPAAPRPGIPQQHVHPAIFAKVRQYLEDHALSLTKVMVERALKGDSRCLVWCLDHVWPSPETPAPPLEIPPLTTPEEVAAFGAAIFQALSQGGLTLEQADGYMALLKNYSELLEMDEFKKRLLSLEQGLRGAGSGGGAKRQKITLGAFDKPF